MRDGGVRIRRRRSADIPARRWHAGARVAPALARRGRGLVIDDQPAPAALLVDERVARRRDGGIAIAHFEQVVGARVDRRVAEDADRALAERDALRRALLPALVVVGDRAAAGAGARAAPH